MIGEEVRFPDRVVAFALTRLDAPPSTATSVNQATGVGPGSSSTASAAVATSVSTSLSSSGHLTSGMPDLSGLEFGPTGGHGRPTVESTRALAIDLLRHLITTADAVLVRPVAAGTGPSGPGPGLSGTCAAGFGSSTWSRRHQIVAGLRRLLLQPSASGLASDTASEFDVAAFLGSMTCSRPTGDGSSATPTGAPALTPSRASSRLAGSTAAGLHLPPCVRLGLAKTVLHLGSRGYLSLPGAVCFVEFIVRQCGFAFQEKVAYSASFHTYTIKYIYKSI
ncbi:unnamed protein product [Protopolystoma xenopodis]|uniref:Uncharacterized protein n=1 Tax=Protopolystoma xenopodis TaxID=117903 RepID=A0A3S5A9E0_9PLAT|nr:unnamed protein product [Protopolystoma xenopodis]